MLSILGDRHRQADCSVSRYHDDHDHDARYRVSCVMNRNRLPTWVNRSIDRIADAPMSLTGRLVAKRLGAPAPFGSIPATEFASKPTRVLIAPVNYSEQGFAWARALEGASDTISARNMSIAVPGGFSFRTDLEVPVGTYHNDRDWQERQLLAASHATHVLIEAEEPPFGRLLGRSVERQAATLSAHGVDVAYLAHGTDVRLPSRHAAGNEWSSFHDPSLYVPRAEELAARNIALLERSGRALFVSTPDLLIDLPNAHWCPVAVDVERWSPPRVHRPPGAPLRVVHSPSNPVLKGTPLILPILEKLQAEGIIEYRLVHGTPSGEMPGIFAGADVMLDQFRAGSYGVAACEAMAAGCVVVGQLSDQVVTAVEARAGMRLPIVNATVTTLEETLRDLAASPDLPSLAAESHAFVRRMHDGRASADALITQWLAPAHSKKV